MVFVLGCFGAIEVRGMWWKGQKSQSTVLGITIQHFISGLDVRRNALDHYKSWGKIEGGTEDNILRKDRVECAPKSLDFHGSKSPARKQIQTADALDRFHISLSARIVFMRLMRAALFKQDSAFFPLSIARDQTALISLDSSSTLHHFLFTHVLY